MKAIERTLNQKTFGRIGEYRDRYFILPSEIDVTEKTFRQQAREFGYRTRKYINIDVILLYK